MKKPSTTDRMKSQDVFDFNQRPTLDDLVNEHEEGPWDDWDLETTLGGLSSPDL